MTTPIEQIREKKQFLQLSDNNTKLLMEIVGDEAYKNISQDPEALGMLFNLYDIHNEYFRGYTVNMLQMAIENQNRLCIYVLEGMQAGFEAADDIINRSVEEQKEKVEHRKRLVKLAVHMAISIPLSIAGIPVNAFIEQITHTTGSSSFANVPTVSGNKLTFDWAQDVDIWKTAKEEYAGAFLKGVVSEVQGQVTTLAKDMLFKLTGEGILDTMTKSANSSREVFNRLKFEVRRQNSEIKMELVERLEDKSTRTQFKEYVVQDLNYLFKTVIALKPSNEVNELKNNYYLALAWIRRVMRTRTKMLKTTLLRRVNIDEAQQETYIKVLSKLSVLYWLGGTSMKTMNAQLCDGLVSLDLITGIHAMEYNSIQHPKFTVGIPCTKSDLKQWRIKRNWHGRKIVRTNNYGDLGIPARLRLHELVTTSKSETIRAGVINALQLVAVNSSIDMIEVDNALSMLGVVKYTDKSEEIKTNLFGTPSKSTREGLPQAVQSPDGQSMILAAISKLLQLWIQGSTTKISTPNNQRSAKPARFPLMKALITEKPSIIDQERSYYGYTELNTVSNGNCFFDAIIKSIDSQFENNSLKYDIPALRAACATEYLNYIQKHPYDCRGFGLNTDKSYISSVSELIAKDNKWDFQEFDLVVGCIMPRIIGRQIVTIQNNNGSQWISGVQLESDNNLPPVYISYNGTDHYIALKKPEPIEANYDGLIDFSDFIDDDNINDSSPKKTPRRRRTRIK